MAPLLSKNMSRLHRYWITLASLLSLNECSLCGAALGLRAVPFCEQCTTAITQPVAMVCRRCGYPLPEFDTTSRTCPNCAGRILYIDRTYPLFPLSREAQALLHKVKFQAKAWLLESLLDHVTISLPLTIPENNYDLILPVPLTFLRRWHRGFNQSEIIARFLSRRMKALRLYRSILMRRETLTAQSLLGRKERLTNVRLAFKIRNSQLVHNKRILLIDDVITTGATANECARILKAAGAKMVSLVVLFRAMPQRNTITI